MKVLICDDEYATRLIMKAYLEIYSIEILEASNGEEALSIIDKENPDVLIIDYTMPEMTGLDVVKKLNRTPPVIVVVTSEGFMDETEQELRAHSSGYLVKPVTEEKLIEAIEKATGKKLNEYRKA